MNKALHLSNRNWQYIRYEQGAQEMGIAKLRALCLALGVSADYLLGLPRGLSWPR